MKQQPARIEIDHDEDAIVNPSANPHFGEVLNARLSRRGLLKGGVGGAALSMFGAFSLAACGSDDDNDNGGGNQVSALGFTAVAKSLADAVVVPAGYTATPILRLGDPMNAATAAYGNLGAETGDSFEHRLGDHHDGMFWFGVNAAGTAWDANASARGLLAMNHENITQLFLHANGPTTVEGVRTVADECIKEMNAHGVSINELVRSGGGYAHVPTSGFNRRVTSLTPVDLAGPVAQSALVVTKYSTTGAATRGTINNCANGNTPWGTYLTCEENWAGYFKRAATDDASRSAAEVTALKRVGINAGNSGNYRWTTVVTEDAADTRFARWNASVTGETAADDFRNAPNTFGWVVEIDPFAPAAAPRKRTALGRFGHEGAWLGPVTVGKPLVWYMGDDARNEYIYKFVSKANWDAADIGKGYAAGDKYMNDGTLYVAKFNADGSGQWIELSFGKNGITAAAANYPFASQADVLVNARLAADVVGATKMDRPEWTAVNPVNGEVYVTLTNSNAGNRTLASVDAANPRHYNDRKTTGGDQWGNPNGHILRWKEAGGDAAATTFTWDIYAFGARSTADAATINLSNLTADNDFSSPDGLWFSRANPGLLWIETDDGAYTDVTNCMLLAAVPGKVGDGASKSVTSTDSTGATKTVTTYVGKAPGTLLRRFLVGPKQCEITGLAETPDGETLFVNIQHPGEDTASVADPAAFGSHWPEGGTARPRSATLVIRKTGGGKVGV
ncbi:PhoX family protein [Derxia gummosa]|uniref:PhoX family protein n=1 Tax=Derxia gummosa DSM 723 TaxID=1121388 RepID=A0A8B6X893_9BURK|nr:PhoX family phosphatase [Derxia gummosa]